MRVYVRKQGTHSQPWRVYCPDCTRTVALAPNWGEAMRRASRHVALHEDEERRWQADRYASFQRRTLVERITDPSAAARARKQVERFLRSQGVDR